MSQNNPERVLVCAPYGRDAEMIRQVLGRAGIDAVVCLTIDCLCAELGESTGAALLSDQGLTVANVSALARALQAQPPWSDLPLLVTTTGGEVTEISRRRLEMLEPLGNVTLLERPLRTATLVSAVRTGLRARQRQYQLRDHLRERERLMRELERSNEELARFAHIVSHDLQTPLRSVKSFGQLLARRYRGQLDATADEFLETIDEAADTMGELIRTLLHYATVGQEPVVRKRLGMQSVVEAVLTLLQPMVDELQAEITYSKLPTVQGDRVLLQQLIQNLVGNALKYRKPERAPRIRIAAQQRESEWVISVADNGQGIAPQYQEHVFQPLQRLHGKEIAGTGMGLAVCQKIVERHGGRIWVESEPGVGSTFCFTLPAS